MSEHNDRNDWVKTIIENDYDYVFDEMTGEITYLNACRIKPIGKFWITRWWYPIYDSETGKYIAYTCDGTLEMVAR